MEQEIWKDIVGFEDSYAISNLGRIKSKQRKRPNGNTLKEKILKPSMNGLKYMQLQLCRNDIKQNWLIHRLMGIHFIPNPENKPEVNHKNGIKYDNRLENLEWATTSENRVHSYDVLKNKAAMGIQHPNAKFTDNDIRAIRYICASKLGMTKTELAKLWNVHFETMKKIVLFRTWKHVA